MGGDDDLFGVFDDLEQQAEALYDAERAPELADRSRAEYQQVTLTGRLMASAERQVVLDVAGVGLVRGELVRVASGWCEVRTSTHAWTISLAAMAAIEGASDRAVPEVAWPVTARLGLGSALRRLADGGERCVVHRRDGHRHDGVVHRVGHDFVEMAEGDPGRMVLVALDVVAAVQTAADEA